MIRVRFPPSPTGIPHIGNTRTALFNYLFAKHNSGVFILRIEDTDRVRMVPGAEEAIKEILNWLGLIPDEFYKQSERLDLYKKAADELLKKGLAKEDEQAVRFIIPKNKTVAWIDAVGNKEISFQSDDLEDFIILKSDGFPTYHLANVVDDRLMKISHVIRGDEWISSTPKHILLYEAFGWKHPTFAHLPVILGPDRTKLSKRHGAESVLELRDQGYLPEAVNNFMALLGWSPGGDREIMTMDEEMISLFDLKDVNTSPSVFDINKLDWMNGHYIRQLNTDELFERIKDKGLMMKDEKLARKFVSPAQSRMKTLNDFVNLVRPFVEATKLKLTNEQKELIEELLVRFERISDWKYEKLYVAIRHLCMTRKVNLKVVYKALTGKEEGLPLADTFEILGKEKTLERLKRLLES